MRHLFLGCVFVMSLALVPAFASTGIDMGDLPMCSYPTAWANPGHSISGIAWLGECVTADATPHPADTDSCDDGVTFLNPQWQPCTVAEVEVVVTAGPFYTLHQSQGGRLFLNAWKDGNLDGDFCDVLCDGLAPEWIIQDVQVTPGTAVYSFIDPGVTDMGTYRGVFRFRLTRNPLGRFGFGLYDTTVCPLMCGGSLAYDSCGEVEDYIIPDLQLAVNLLGDVVATSGDGKVTLSWATASESNNDHFAILRDGRVVGQVAGAGTSPSRHDYTWTEAGLTNGQTYRYTLRSMDMNGSAVVLASVSATPNFTAGQVAEYALHQNHPNPFNPSTQIVFDLKEDTWVRLRVYDLLGREVANLVDAPMMRGRHAAGFDGTSLSSGLYIARISAGGFTGEIKMLLLR